MSFKLNSVVPWGRNISEYREMFLLSDEDMKKRIAGFGDGPASFNYQASEQGSSVTSFDPIYQFSEKELFDRINEVRDTVIQQMRENMENYVWDRITSVEQLEEIRMSAMRMFLADFEQGKKEHRYIYHELPDKLPYADNSFDIGLSSHFLLMYTGLGYDFHVEAITEMLRVCKEVRVFPLCDLDSNSSEMIEKVIEYFRKSYAVEIKETDYEFQKGANRLLIIKKNM
jgi:hypothetical protein